MNKYVIFTDSACDISKATLEKWDVKCLNITYRFDGESEDHTSDDTDIKTFYDKMRAGGTAKTAAINSYCFEEYFEEELKKGHDILYLGFSSGLSTTYNCSKMAVDELKEKYPERKIITVDSLSASAGQGLFVYLVAKEQENGASIEDAAKFAKDLVPKTCAWFTVDDLEYLKRGGRISPTTAFVGNVLGIKPVLKINGEGKLISIEKARGRKSSLRALFDKYDESADNKTVGTVFISHADCLEDAQKLADMIKGKSGKAVDVITDIGPVIGAHTGPGCIALFFVGNKDLC